MTEWHLTPEYLNNNWTEELLSLMFEKRNERIEREIEAAREARAGRSITPPGRRVDNHEFFSRHRIKVTEIN